MIKIAHLGPAGTNAETAAIAYSHWLHQTQGREFILQAYPTIAQTLHGVATKEVDLAVVPVENSIEGSLAVTLDLMWELDHLQIQHALILPISHLLLSYSPSIATIERVYSHPQALAQCQRWLEKILPSCQLVSCNSTTEPLELLAKEVTSGAIASPRAAELYQLPILATEIQDYPDNSTRFWVVGLQPSHQGNHISLAFSLPANVPGALVCPLEIFAQKGINLSRIESRPTKRSLGEYLFFIDLESSQNREYLQAVLEELPARTEVLKVFGSYDPLFIDNGKIVVS